jgi:hypothetical protein
VTRKASLPEECIGDPLWRWCFGNGKRSQVSGFQGELLLAVAWDSDRGEGGKTDCD